MRILILFFLLIFYAGSSFAQSGREHYISVGANAGIFGWAPSPQTKISGNRHYNRTTNGILGS
ncbi:MAG: hypothetical protein ACRC3B_01215, partial [Bacteroidia bacterium]